MNIEEKNEFLRQEMYNTPGNIVSVGFGWKTTDGKLVSDNAIIYGVTEKKPLDQIPQNERIPSSKTVNGEVFITDVIEGNIKKAAECDSWGRWRSQTPSNRNEFRPLKGGISITNYTQLNTSVGTLGFIAIDNEDEKLIGITNNHVVVKDAFYTIERNNDEGEPFENTSGSVATQPNDNGIGGLSYRIGLVKKYVPLFESASLKNVDKVINTVDAAAISIDTGLIDTAESWKQEGFTELTSAPRFATTNEINAVLANTASAYYSSGRTTGMKPPTTDDLLRRYEESTYITVGDYQKQGVDTPAIVNNVFSLYATYASNTLAACYFPIEAGDSGSAVFAYVIDDLTGQEELKIVGLVFAGLSQEIIDPATGNVIDEWTFLAYVCRIDQVADQLNIKAWDGTFTDYATNTNLDTRVVSGTSKEKFINVGSDIYWQVGLVNNATNPPDYP